MLNGTQMITWKESIPSSNPIKVWTILQDSKSIAWTFFSLWRFGIRDYKLGFLGTHDGHRQRSPTHRKCTESARGHLEHSGKNDESLKNYDIIVTIIFFFAARESTKLGAASSIQGFGKHKRSVRRWICHLVRPRSDARRTCLWF